MTSAQALGLGVALGIALVTVTVCCLAADRCVRGVSRWAAARFMLPAVLRRTR